VLRRRSEAGRVLAQRALVCLLVMWGTLVAWTVVVYVLWIVGFILAWR
jgi:hypothetical protein